MYANIYFDISYGYHSETYKLKPVAIRALSEHAYNVRTECLPNCESIHILISLLQLAIVILMCLYNNKI